MTLASPFLAKNYLIELELYNSNRSVNVTKSSIGISIVTKINM